MYIYPPDVEKPEDDYRGYGPAVSMVYEKQDGTLWAASEDGDRPEYLSQVNFCPFTGYEAKVKINP